MTRREYMRKKLMEHLVGPTGSIILHILIFAALIHLVVFETRQSEQEIEVTLMELQTVDLEELLEEIEPEIEPEELDVMIDAPSFDVEVDVAPVEDFSQPEPDVDYAALNVMNMDSPLVLQGLFSGRTAAGRAARLKQYGGRWGELTEASVQKALEWLKKNQNPDGSWDHGARSPAAMTGLGLLTFLAHGETVSSEKYGQTVEKAIRWLVNDMQPNGMFKGVGTGNGTVYAQAIAAYAMSEAYAMTRIPDIKPVMDKAIQVIIDGQQARGGWDYQYKKESRRDTSIAGFNIQGLKAALLAGSSATGIKQTMDKSLEDLLTVFNPETGSFGYSSVQGRNDSMTALACLLFQLAGNPRAPEVRAGVTALRDVRCNWNDPPQGAMYTWYYMTQVMFQTGGSTWNSWNNMFAPQFVNNQNADGSWTSPSGRLPQGTPHREVNYGPVYSTTLAALSLQVYYRILPTFAVVEQPAEEEEKKTDDVIIEII